MTFAAGSGRSFCFEKKHCTDVCEFSLGVGSAFGPPRASDGVVHAEGVVHLCMDCFPFG